MILGKSVGGDMKISFSNLNEVITIQYSGKNKITMMMIATILNRRSFFDSLNEFSFITILPPLYK
jgi:hypothetical protein